LLQDDEVEEPLLEDFKALRRKLFSWHSECGGGWRQCGRFAWWGGVDTVLPWV
jgi:hypothetical protein